jgi:hypothetical protein
METFKIIAAACIGGYALLYVYFYLLWGVSYAGLVVLVTINAWVTQKQVDVDSLSCDFHKMASNKFWRPFMGILLTIFVALCLVVCIAEITTNIVVHRLVPFLKKIPRRMPGNFKLKPDWATNESVAAFINRLTGVKRD